MRRGELSVEPREDPELAAAPAAVPPNRAGWPHVATAPTRPAPGMEGSRPQLEGVLWLPGTLSSCCSLGNWEPQGVLHGRAISAGWEEFFLNYIEEWEETGGRWTGFPWSTGHSPFWLSIIGERVPKQYFHPHTLLFVLLDRLVEGNDEGQCFSISLQSIMI